MKKLLVLAALAGLAWFGYTRTEAPAVVAPAPPPAAPLLVAPATPAFSCDGRTQCTQMRSCEEATYFIQHCPRTEMDGDGDGVPCERQWCAP